MLFSAKEASEAPFVLVVDTNQVKSLKSSDVGKVAAAPSVIGILLILKIFVFKQVFKFIIIYFCSNHQDYK